MTRNNFFTGGKWLLISSSLLLGISVVTAIASLAQEEVATGSFPQAEYRIKLPGIEQICKQDQLTMTVVDDKDEASPAYPIVEYDGVAPILPNSQGIFVVHHIALSPEFTIRRRNLFWLLPITTKSLPQYKIKIFCGNKLVKQFPYRHLVDKSLQSSGNKIVTWQIPHHRYPAYTPERLNPNLRNGHSNEYITYEVNVL